LFNTEAEGSSKIFQPVRLIKFGETFHIHCKWTFSVKWFYTTITTIQDFSIISESPTLTIKKSHFNDTGYYYCLGKKMKVRNKVFHTVVPIIVFGEYTNIYYALLLILTANS